jgi:uncharacterized iron-regulated membrane protein
VKVTGRVRKISIVVHRYVGLAAAAFLVVSGLTGSILAFESEFDRWTHPSLWRVAPESSRLSEQTLADLVVREMTSPESTAKIELIEFGGNRGAQVFDLADGRRVFVNPYRGSILGVRNAGPSASDKFFFTVRQLHIRLLAGIWGRWIVEIASGALLLLIPTGIYLWWDRKRANVKWKASWRRVNWDLHNVLGLYGFAVMVILAGSGLLISFPGPLYFVTGSAPQMVEALPRSTPPENPSANFHEPELDKFMLAAESALPGSVAIRIQLPRGPRSPVQLQTRGSETSSPNTVYLDRYDGHILRVDDSNKRSPALRAFRTNQAVHTGTIWGLASKIVVSLSSLMLAASVITGFIVWWRKTAA